jgi:mRNA interferase MazF
MMMRGDIHYIQDTKDSTGSEQRAGRPAVIVSNNAGNVHSPVVEVVFLTTKPKADLPTHVTIRGTVKVSTALCEQITSVSIERVGDYIGTVSDSEMDKINNALLVSLDLPIHTVAYTPDDALLEKVKLLEAEYEGCVKERDYYKKAYDDFVDKLLRRAYGN